MAVAAGPSPVAVAGGRRRWTVAAGPSPLDRRLWPSPVAVAGGHWTVAGGQKKARMRGLESAGRMLVNYKPAGVAFCRAFSVQRHDDVLRFNVAHVAIVSADTL